MAEQNRAPIVTILGHVDHGKTSLLDFIRSSSVAAKEHGGITQHIGAYQIVLDGKAITFIDTPGHAAFEKMRSRGANVADIAVLVVAADDGIMPQTLEAIKHIKVANVPMIVAVNKVDLLSTLRSSGGDLKIDYSNPELKIALDKIKKQLSDRDVLIEEYGGDVPIVPLSAKTGEGVDKLLETILLVAELNELKGDPEKAAVGVVIESSLDKFKGPIATLLIRDGSLEKGESITVSGVKAKIRGLFNYENKPIDIAGPSMPVEVLGFESVPGVGATLGEETKSKAQIGYTGLSLVDKLKQKGQVTLKVIVKADKQGSLEAVEDSLDKFNEEIKRIEVVSKGIGDINESDIKVAAGTKAIVIGFNVKTASSATKLAEIDMVLVRSYNIIYELIDEIGEVIESMTEKGQLEEVIGRAEIIAEFPFGKNERIAGSRMLEGYISKNSRLRVLRDNTLVTEAKIKSLRKVKDEVQRVEKGQDCGIIFETETDFRIGDTVEAYRVL